MEYTGSSSLSTRRVALLTVVVVALVAVLPATAVPVCEWQGEVTRCSVSQQSDFGALPTNVTRLSVYFPAGHQAALRTEAFPLRPNLMSLTVDLTNVNAGPEPGVFRLLGMLETLTLEHMDPIYAPPPLSLPAGVFQGLPDLQDLKLERVGLTQVDKGTFSDLSSLRTLDLSNNDLTSFPSGGFENTTQLVTLVFINNKLAGLFDGTFHGLVNLQTLNLENNKISELNGATFGNLPALQTLSLEGNMLRSIEQGAFQGLSMLTKLELKNNELGRIHANMFKGLASLETLDISHNKLVEIADLAFSDLSNLQFLEIFENSIKELTPQTFVGLEKLIFLDIYRNNFTQLNDDVFRSLTQLATLHIHDAKIHTITKGAFNGLDFLNVLTLQQNNLTTLPKGVFDKMEQLTFIDISMNPWNCSCGITWIYLWSIGKNLGAEDQTRCGGDGQALREYARDNHDICMRTTTTTTTTTTTPLPVTSAVSEQTTSAPLIKLTSSMDPGYFTTNHSNIETASAGLSKDNMLIIIIAASCVFVLLVLIAVFIIYCRQKKCAFWTPEHLSGIPTSTGTTGLEKDISHFAYSPTKEQSFFGGQPNGAIEHGKSHERAERAESAYDNPALYMEDGVPVAADHADPAVVAYITENGVNHYNGHPPHSYEHRVSDNGTHYVDRVPHHGEDNNMALNDLSPAEVQQKAGKKDKKRKKPKKRSVSSSDNGDDPYSEVYASPGIPMSDMIPSPPAGTQGDAHYPQRLHVPRRDPERDSALGASTEEPSEDPPTPQHTDHHNLPAHNVYFTDGQESGELDRMKRHSDSIGGNSDYVDYGHSYNEDKPLY